MNKSCSTVNYCLLPENRQEIRHKKENINSLRKLTVIMAPICHPFDTFKIIQTKNRAILRLFKIIHVELLFTIVEQKVARNMLLWFTNGFYKRKIFEILNCFFILGFILWLSNLFRYEHGDYSFYSALYICIIPCLTRPDIVFLVLCNESFFKKEFFEIKV